MSEMRLLKSVKVEHDIEKAKFRFAGIDSSKPPKKVSSRAFPSLIGENKWESIGSATLERYRALEKEDIDNFYSVRGDIAEILVYDFLRDFYRDKLHAEIGLKTWDKKAINYDNFQKNEKFGGMIDIALFEPKEYQAVVEVKSKSSKDRPKIKENKGNKEEVFQGVYLTWLSGIEKCLMVYVFFTPTQEQFIREYLQTQENIGYNFDSKIYAKEIIKAYRWNHNQFDIVPFPYKVTDYDMDSLTKVAHNNLMLFGKNFEISEHLFTSNEFEYLRDLANGGNGIPKDADDLFSKGD